MESTEVVDSPSGKTLESSKSTILINDSEFSYSISKLEKDEGIKIKLFESNPRTNIYYEYEASTSQLTSSIKTLLICEDLDEMITTLKMAFDEGRAKFLQEHDKSFIELSFEAMGKSKVYKIEFNKFEPKDPLTELNDKITSMQNEYKNLSKEIEELKKIKNNDVDLKEKIKEVFQDKDMKMKLYEEFEQIMCSKFNLTKEKKEDKKGETYNSSNIENTVKEIIKNEFGEKVNNIENKLNERINDLNQIKSSLDYVGNDFKSKSNYYSEIDKYIQSNETLKKITENINSLKNGDNNNNFIEIKINVKEKSKKIKFIQQTKTYKYFYNFERDDIELLIDGEKASLLNFERYKEFEEEEKSKNCYKAQKIEYNLENGFYFYLYFHTEGIHTIKIIFRKKLYNCDFLFHNCKDITEIDLLNFDCSQVISCESMFDGCISLKKINLGNLDFSLCENFKCMFNGCYNLENLDVSHFNTKNSSTFEKMFCKCKKLKNIDVYKFNSSRCEFINSMFEQCENLSEINMINWDMKLLHISEVGIFSKKYEMNSINRLFYGCKNLKLIKMRSNFSNSKLFIFEEKKNEIFKGLPPGGSFYWKKGVNCDKLLSQLPVSWNRVME